MISGVTPYFLFHGGMIGYSIFMIIYSMVMIYKSGKYNDKVTAVIFMVFSYVFIICTIISVISLTSSKLQS